MRTTGAVALAIVLGTTAVLSSFRITNLDIGGHLTVGREIVASRAIPSRDFFSHTVRGEPYPVHQWLGQVGLWTVESAAGVPGLVFLRVLVALAGIFVLHRHARREGAGPFVAAASLLLLLPPLQLRLFVRPFLATLVFLPVVQLVVSDWRSGRAKSLLIVPVLFTIWGHVHSGVLLGVLFLGAVVTGEAWRTLARRPGALESPRLAHLAAISALSVVLPFATLAFVSPAGFEPLLLPLKFFASQETTGMIAEYRPVELSRDWPFVVVAGLLALGAALAPRRLTAPDLLLAAGFGVMAFRAVRGILPFAIVAAPLLARTWGDVAGRVARSGRWPLRGSRGALVGLAVLAAAGAALSVRAARGTPFPFGIGKDPKHYPERALDFLETEGVEGPLFNTDLWASSILWRWHGEKHPVFVDARLEAYPETFWRDVYYRVLEAAPGWRGALDRYGVQFAMLRRVGGQADDRIGDVLWGDPSWGVVYWDDHVMILVRRDSDSSTNRAVLDRWEFTSFSPRRPGDVEELRGEALARAEAELARLAQFDPDTFLPRWALAAARAGLGRGDEALALYDDLARRPEARDNEAFRAAHAEAQLVAGRTAAWEQYIVEAGRDPSSAAERFYAASRLARAGKRDAAIAQYRGVLRADPNETDAMNNLALLLAEESEGVDEALALLDEAIRRRPQDPYYLASLGEVNVAAGAPEKAAAHFRRALELLPESDESARRQLVEWLDELP